MNCCNERVVDWLLALNSNIKKLGFIEPKNITDISYDTDEKSSKNPDQINYAFLIIQKLIKKEVKETNLRATITIVAQQTKESNQSLPKTFEDIFTEDDWAKYLDALVKCEPQLLTKKNDSYHFVGNKITQRGVIAAWFKYLKSKGIIDRSLNRNQLASVLSSNIDSFTICGASIDNQSKIYNKVEPQLIELIK